MIARLSRNDRLKLAVVSPQFDQVIREIELCWGEGVIGVRYLDGDGKLAEVGSQREWEVCWREACERFEGRKGGKIDLLGVWRRKGEKNPKRSTGGDCEKKGQEREKSRGIEALLHSLESDFSEQEKRPSSEDSFELVNSSNSSPIKRESSPKGMVIGSNCSRSSQNRPIPQMRVEPTNREPSIFEELPLRKYPNIPATAGRSMCDPDPFKPKEEVQLSHPCLAPFLEVFEHANPDQANNFLHLCSLSGMTLEESIVKFSEIITSA